MNCLIAWLDETRMLKRSTRMAQQAPTVAKCALPSNRDFSIVSRPTLSRRVSFNLYRLARQTCLEETAPKGDFFPSSILLSARNNVATTDGVIQAKRCVA
jgi:hypothetical protein